MTRSDAVKRTAAQADAVNQLNSLNDASVDLESPLPAREGLGGDSMAESAEAHPKPAPLRRGLSGGQEVSYPGNAPPLSYTRPICHSYLSALSQSEIPPPPRCLALGKALRSNRHTIAPQLQHLFLAFRAYGTANPENRQNSGPFHAGHEVDSVSTMSTSPHCAPVKRTRPKQFPPYCSRFDLHPLRRSVT